MDTLDVFTDLTTREMQVYGALCLRRFCKAKGIEHPYIDELIEHLLSILTIDQLDGWEGNGAVLSLSGRGDPLPEALATQFADDVREDFKRLVYFVVEIGFADVYGDPSKRPLHNLFRCLAILDANGVERPSVGELFKDRTARGETVPDWGEIFSQERYEQVRALFR